MKVRSLIITVVSSLIVGGGVWAIGLVCFTRLVPFTSPELIMPTEGIVVFTGGVGRLTAALTLFQEGKGKYLLISGVNPDSTFPSTIADLPQRSRITLGYEALDTPGNAEETARWVRQNHIKTLRLITSHYHMPRSLLELRRLLPDGGGTLRALLSLCRNTISFFLP